VSVTCVHDVSYCSVVISVPSTRMSWLHRSLLRGPSMPTPTLLAITAGSPMQQLV
jgi:hypothetical protein